MPRYSKRLAITCTLGSIVVGSIAGGSWIGSSASAEPSSPQDYIRIAARQAEKLATIDAALQKLEKDGNEGPAIAEAANVSAMITERVLTTIDEMPKAPTFTVPKTSADWHAMGLDLKKAKKVDGKFVQTLANGWKVEFSIDPASQARVKQVAAQSGATNIGVVLIEPDTGRVRAHVGHGTTSRYQNVASAPSASVFKIISAGMYLERGIANADTSVCYHGGRSRLSKTNIAGSKKRDTKCTGLENALAFSINSVFAKLAYKNVSKAQLTKWVNRFGFNSDIPFQMPVQASEAIVPADKYERARMAAGFYHSKLSPLHSAMISASMRNGGKMMTPSIVDQIVDKNGKVIWTHTPSVWKQPIGSSTAQTLWSFMQSTTKKGTARRYFNGKNAIANVVTSGKTGTLSEHNPYVGHSWFSGVSRHQVSGKEIAVGALVSNPEKWRIKGAYAAREAVAAYFKR